MSLRVSIARRKKVVCLATSMRNKTVRYRRYFVDCLHAALSVAVILILSSSISLAKGSFVIEKDNSIQVGNIHFANMQEYIVSEYFRKNGKRCGTRRPLVRVDDQRARSVNDCTLELTRIQDEYWLSTAVITIPVWVHVIYRSDGVGNIPDATINDQVAVLNEDFRAMMGTLGSQGFDTRVRFTLAGITRTQNDSWFNDEDNAAYTKALHKDPLSYVNIYTNTASGDLGYSTFPQEAAGLEADGIVMNYAMIGGRDNGEGIYNQGRTLVHEMGHYLGLYHTFEGYRACGNTYTSGDLIVDTPAEDMEHYECVNVYSCTTTDPIHNYMNYTPDSCMTEFTREQANRMVCSLLNYRPGLNKQDKGGFVVPPFLVPLLFGK